MIYIVIIEDRHTDVDVIPYEDPDFAVEWAKREVRDRNSDPEDLDEELNDEMIHDGWLYYGCYSTEGDSIRVVKRELRC